MYPEFIRRDHPDDQYLFEFDRDEKGRMRLDTDGVNVKFTDRAKAAQEAVCIIPRLWGVTSDVVHRNGGG